MFFTCNTDELSAPRLPKGPLGGEVWRISEACTMSKPRWGSSIQAVAQRPGGCLTIWADSSDLASHAWYGSSSGLGHGAMVRRRDCVLLLATRLEQRAASQRHPGPGGRPDKQRACPRNLPNPNCPGRITRPRSTVQAGGNSKGPQVSCPPAGSHVVIVRPSWARRPSLGRRIVPELPGDAAVGSVSHN